MAKRHLSQVEWTDPRNGQVYTCPALFVDGVRRHLAKGSGNGKTAAKILAEMNQPITPVNERHIRHACLFEKRRGIPVISVRSSEGGYFIAQTQAEVNEYVDEQLKFAKAMIVEAINLRRRAIL